MVYKENFPHKKPLEQECTPLSDEELEACPRTKRAIVMCDDKDVERVRQTIGSPLFSISDLSHLPPTMQPAVIQKVTLSPPHQPQQAHSGNRIASCLDY